jgi:hypothetical protein
MRQLLAMVTLVLAIDHLLLDGELIIKQLKALAARRITTMARHLRPRPRARWPVGRMLGLGLGGYALIAALVLPQPRYDRVLDAVFGLVIIGYSVDSARLRSLADEPAQGFARLLTTLAGLVALQSMNESLTLVASAVTLWLISWTVRKLRQARASG